MSLTAAIALGASASAFADGASDNTAQILGNFNPPLQSGTDAGTVNLFTQLMTYDNDNNNGCTEPCDEAIPAEPPESESVEFPAELVYTSNSKLPQCTEAAISAATTDGAMAACPTSVIGGGNALARIPGFPTANNESELTVTAFNGPPSSAGDNASDQVTNTGFVGGFPTIILHADNTALPTTVVSGEVGNATSGPDYGRRLYVPDAPDVARVGADDFGALVLFNASVSRKWTNGKSGDKKKTYQLTKATCGGPDGDWDFKRTVVYDDDSTETDTNTQDCGTKP